MCWFVLIYCGMFNGVIERNYVKVDVKWSEMDK